MRQHKLILSVSRSDPHSTLEESYIRGEDSKIFQLRDSYISFLTDPEQQDRQAQKNQKKIIEIPKNIQQIMQKEHQQRSSAQNSILTKYLMRFKIFKEMSEKLSLDVVKNMIKQGDLHLYNQGDHLTTQGKKMKKVRILLTGELGLVSQEKYEENSLDLWDTLYQLVEKLGKQSKYFKLKNLGSSKNIAQNQMQKSYIMKKQTMIQHFDFQCIGRFEPNTFLDFAPLLNYDPKYSQTLGVIEDRSLVFTLGIESFYECLFLFYNAKLNKVIKIFRKVPIFNQFDNSKLKILIQKLKIVEFKKNQFIYKEKTQPDRFYLLTEGQIQISKTISIFSQNPNNLYKSRAKVSRDHLNKNIKVLSYANFNGVYNYQPQDKLIVLTLVNPICVFGEQELIENTARQVNARVISLTAKMYEIFLTDIQQFCSKISGNNTEKKMTLVNFFSLVEESITLKKILYRQTKLSDMIEHENKSKFKTLFVDQPKRKSSIKRNHFTRATSYEKSPRKNQRRQDEVPPAFNNFNYTDFCNQKEPSSQMLPSNLLNDDEMKIIRLTHTKFSSTATESKKKRADTSIRVRNHSVDLRMSKKNNIDNLKTMESMNSTTFILKQKFQKRHQKQNITLQQPLFNLKYFMAMQHHQKRLVFETKKKKLEEIYRHSPQRH